MNAPDRARRFDLANASVVPSVVTVDGPGGWDVPHGGATATAIRHVTRFIRSEATESRAIVADSNPLMQRALIEILRNDLGLSDVEEADSIDKLNRALAHAPARVLLVDSSLLREPGGLAVKSLAFAAEDCAIVVFADKGALLHAPEWLEQGASAVLDKRVDKSAFCDAIRAVLRGERFVKRLDERVWPDSLKASEIENRSKLLRTRDRDVLRLIALGMRNREIAVRLGICEPTVKAYVGRALIALGVCNRTKAAIYANWLLARGLL